MSEFDRIFAYCADLDAHNDRTWFHANHAQYDRAKADFYGLLDLMRFTIAQNCPALSDDLMCMHPKDWMYRVARDMRYHRDGPPYDPAFRAFLAADRKSWHAIGYFIHLFPNNSYFGTGLWLPRPGDVNTIRDAILAHPVPFRNALRSLGDIPLQGDRLKKMPRGYEAYADHPLAPVLQLKNYLMMTPLPMNCFDCYSHFEEEITKAVRAMEPMRLFLCEASSHISQRSSQL